MKNQILIFLPEVANSVRRSGCNEASAFDEGRENINGHSDSYGNTHDYDYAQGRRHDIVRIIVMAQFQFRQMVKERNLMLQ